jgi:hypothetical protein
MKTKQAGRHTGQKLKLKKMKIKGWLMQTHRPLQMKHQSMHASMSPVLEI